MSAHRLQRLLALVFLGLMGVLVATPVAAEPGPMPRVLGPAAPPHRAVVDGDTKSAAVAAASIVAKVVRDRLMRRLAALYPRYGFSSHVGYITPGHTAAVLAHGPCEQHRRSFNARAYAAEPALAELLSA